MARTAEYSAPFSPLPTVRRATIGRPFVWLRLGWGDFRRVPTTSLAFGALVAAFGAILLLLAWQATYLVPALLGGFLLVAPFLAIALYALSQQIEQGVAIDPTAAFLSWRRNANSIALFGLLLALALILWERISAIVFALFYGGEVTGVGTLIVDVLLSGRYTELLIAYFGIGGLLAAAVFAVSVVTAPLLLDRGVDVVTAVVTSMRCCLRNPVAMLVWAALIAGLTLIGFATFMIGLVLVFPVIGHATWDAYREMVAPESGAPASAG